MMRFNHETHMVREKIDRSNDEGRKPPHKSDQEYINQEEKEISIV